MNVEKVTFLSCTLFFILWGLTASPSSAMILRSNVKKVPVLVSPTVNLNDYSRFKEHMLKTKQLSKSVLASKELQDIYNREIVAKGIKIDFTDISQTSSIAKLMSIALCSSCDLQPDVCSCLMNFECNTQC